MSKTLGHVNKVKTKRELVKLVKGPNFDKISKVQDSLKSVPGYEEIFQLMPQGPLMRMVILSFVFVSRLKEVKALDLIGVIFLN